MAHGECQRRGSLQADRTQRSPATIEHHLSALAELQQVETSEGNVHSNFRRGRRESLRVEGLEARNMPGWMLACRRPRPL